jgi:hypothetical protein
VNLKLSSPFFPTFESLISSLEERTITLELGESGDKERRI